MPPSVSVVLPVRDEADNIEALLDDLCAQSRQPHEILVVDTGSRDDTVAIVERVARRDPRVRLLSRPNALPGGGRNEGIEAATGEWVAFIDAGMRIQRDWLAQLMAPADRGDAVDVVFGGLEPVVDEPAERAAALAFVPQRRPVPTGGQWRGVCVPSSAVRTHVAKLVGGFPEDLRSGEDLVFAKRVEELGRVAWAPGAIVRWRHVADSRAIWRRFRLYAEHGFRAGLMKEWFGTLRRRTIGIAAVSGPAMPVAAALLLLARAAVMQRRKPEFVEHGLVRRAVQIGQTALYLGVIDAATWAAWWRWLQEGRPRSPDADAV